MYHYYLDLSEPKILLAYSRMQLLGCYFTDEISWKEGKAEKRGQLNGILKNWSEDRQTWYFS